MKIKKTKYSGAVLLLTLSTSIAHATCLPAESLVHAYGISYSGFDKPPPKSEPQDKPGKSKADIIALPLWRNQPQVRDGFQHIAWINRKTGQAWILRIGGFAGIREWYGPVVVESMDFSGCEIEALQQITP